MEIAARSTSLVVCDLQDRLYDHDTELQAFPDLYKVEVGTGRAHTAADAGCSECPGAGLSSSNHVATPYAALADDRGRVLACGNVTTPCENHADQVVCFAFRMHEVRSGVRAGRDAWLLGDAGGQRGARGRCVSR
jgi:hypothetical protein